MARQQKEGAGDPSSRDAESIGTVRLLWRCGVINCRYGTIPYIIYFYAYYILTQTEYLEETVLRAEARSCAGRRSCSHPWDGQVYLYTWLYRSEASVCCHCFCFSAFDIIKAVQLLLWQAIAFLFLGFAA